MGKYRGICRLPRKIEERKRKEVKVDWKLSRLALVCWQSKNVNPKKMWCLLLQSQIIFSIELCVLFVVLWRFYRPDAETGLCPPSQQHHGGFSGVISSCCPVIASKQGLFWRFYFLVKPVFYAEWLKINCNNVILCQSKFSL